MNISGKPGLFMLALVLLPAVLWAADPETEPEMARVVSSEARATHCLASVAINEIDGEPQQVPARGFELEPGRHSMNGRARLDLTYCAISDGRAGIQVPDLEADFEAGTTYYIGLDHSSENLEEWRLVIWKVEAPGQSEVFYPLQDASETFPE